MLQILCIVPVARLGVEDAWLYRVFGNLRIHTIKFHFFSSSAFFFFFCNYSILRLIVLLLGTKYPVFYHYNFLIPSKRIANQ